MEMIPFTYQDSPVRTVLVDCWAILMPLRSTGSNEHTQWDHFIKELTNG